MDVGFWCLLSRDLAMKIPLNTILGRKAVKHYCINVRYVNNTHNVRNITQNTVMLNESVLLIYIAIISHNSRVGNLDISNHLQ